MTAASPASYRSHLVDLRPLRESPAFARMWAGAALTGVGSQMTIVTVGILSAASAVGMLVLGLLSGRVGGVRAHGPGIVCAVAVYVMRGRLQGPFMVVVTRGPRVGDLYVGALSLTALHWFPPLLGGVVIIAMSAVFLRIYRSLREYDALDPKP